MSDGDWWFLDLSLAVALAGVSAFGLFAGVSGVVRIALAAPLVLVLPGYALVSILFPEAGDEKASEFDEEKTGLRTSMLTDRGIDTVERFVLSVTLTVALVPLVALVASATRWGVTLAPILVGTALTTIALSVLGIVVRSRRPPERRFSVSLSWSPFLIRLSERTPYDAENTTPFNVALMIGVVVLIASAGFAVANPPQGDGFTELYIETENVTGETETVYDASFARGETVELPVYIENHEHRERTYTTVVLLERVTYEGEDVAVHESEELARGTATVPDGDGHQQNLEVTPSMEGDDLRVLVLLYDGEPPAEPTEENAYNSLRLPIEVS